MRYFEIMNIDTTNELRNRTWWWWWWLLFFKNQDNPDMAKQMVILWGTRNCKEVLVNGHRWSRKSDLVKERGRASAYGMATSWYFDGKDMIDPLFIDEGPLTSSWSPGKRELSLTGDGRYVFSGEEDTNKILIARSDVNIDIDLKPWSDFLSDVAPSGKEYFMHLSYTMHKIRGSKAQGRISIGDKTEEVEGTAYFQKVRINSPTSPWYWGVFHSEKGHYIDYFMPHIGPPMFRRTESHSSKLDWGERILSKSWRFYDSDEGVMHIVKNIQMKKRYENDLPIFMLSGDDGDKKFEMEMKSYSRAYRRIQQPLLRIFNTVLYYNEYPANITKFSFESRTGRKTLEDLDYTVGNCEHAWGIV
ncbi:MAG: hypothetical protein KAW09_05920 [Thermoplasmata archaeon]|nr:hypothetical protein [Thermoplasmata archaeon]